MLYIVSVRMILKETGEKIKEKVLIVGCRESDINSKLRWAYDQSKYSSFSVSEIEKVREKIHVISTSIKQEKSTDLAVIERSDGTKNIEYPAMKIEDQIKKFAIGITSVVVASDEEHAMRKIGHAIINRTNGKSHSGASLSEDSTIVIEEIPFSSGYAAARDVSIESNKAHFVRG